MLSIDITGGLVDPISEVNSLLDSLKKIELERQSAIEGLATIKLELEAGKGIESVNKCAPIIQRLSEAEQSLMLQVITSIQKISSIS